MGTATTIKLEYMESLCQLLKCTPNNLLTRDSNLKKPQQMPSLQVLRKTTATVSTVLPILQNLDFEEMDEAVYVLKDRKARKG